MRANYVYVMVAAVLLAACAQMGPKPNNIEQSLVYVSAGLAAAYGVVGDLVIQGRITALQRDTAVEQLDRGYASLKTAKTALKYGKTLLAQTHLERAQSVLANSEAVIKRYKRTQ